MYTHYTDVQLAHCNAQPCDTWTLSDSVLTTRLQVPMIIFATVNLRKLWRFNNSVNVVVFLFEVTRPHSSNLQLYTLLTNINEVMSQKLIGQLCQLLKKSHICQRVMASLFRSKCVNIRFGRWRSRGVVLCTHGAHLCHKKMCTSI